MKGRGSVAWLRAAGVWMGPALVALWEVAAASVVFHSFSCVGVHG